VSTTLQQHTRPLPDEAPLEAARWRDPRYQAFLTLRLGFTVLPIAMGIDKFFNSMVYWPKYLADWIANIPPGTPQQIMYGVGVVEIVAGLVVLAKPRYGAFLVALWLAGIVVNLFSYGWYDIGVRDFGLMLAALTLGRLAWVYDPPLRRRV
jgi:uncharacterized membrane protein YphA (DoxX/SURF4 family)